MWYTCSVYTTNSHKLGNEAINFYLAYHETNLHSLFFLRNILFLRQFNLY